MFIREHANYPWALPKGLMDLFQQGNALLANAFMPFAEFYPRLRNIQGNPKVIETYPLPGKRLETLFVACEIPEDGVHGRQIVIAYGCNRALTSSAAALGAFVWALASGRTDRKNKGIDSSE